MYFIEEQRILQTVTYPVYLVQGLCLKFQNISNSQMATYFVLNHQPEQKLGHPGQKKTFTGARSKLSLIMNSL